MKQKKCFLIKHKIGMKLIMNMYNIFMRDLDLPPPSRPLFTSNSPSTF